jgi:hypothetical protein
MNTLSQELLSEMQDTASKLEALRKIPVEAVRQFERESLEEAARFEDTRVYFDVFVNRWDEFKPQLKVALYSDDELFFEEILTADDVTFDESYAHLTVMGECMGVETETRVKISIPKDYRQFLVNMGKIQTVQELRTTTALLCGS